MHLRSESVFRVVEIETWVPVDLKFSTLGTNTLLVSWYQMLKKVVKVFGIRSHRRRTWTVQSYSPGDANVHPHLLHASVGPPECTSQTASRSVQPFLCSSRQRIAVSFCFTIGRPCPSLKIAHTRGETRAGPSSNMCFHGSTQVRNPNSISIV